MNLSNISSVFNNSNNTIKILNERNYSILVLSTNVASFAKFSLASVLKTKDISLLEFNFKNFIIFVLSIFSLPYFKYINDFNIKQVYLFINGFSCKNNLFSIMFNNPFCIKISAMLSFFSIRRFIISTEYI